MSVTLHVFKSTMSSINYVMKNGKQIPFQLGVYRTSIQTEADELNAEIAAGHPHIYVDKNEMTVESDMVDPMNVLRAKIIADYIAAQAKASDPTNDMGESDQTKLQPANSRDIASAAAGGNSAASLVSNAAMLVSKAAK